MPGTGRETTIGIFLNSVDLLYHEIPVSMRPLSRVLGRKGPFPDRLLHLSLDLCIRFRIYAVHATRVVWLPSAPPFDFEESKPVPERVSAWTTILHCYLGKSTI